MPLGIRKNGVRAFNPPEGRPYLAGEPLSLLAIQPTFTASFIADSSTLSAVMPTFVLDAFHIGDDTLNGVFPRFTVAFTCRAGAIATLAAVFPVFSPKFVLERTWVMGTDFPAFTASFSAIQSDLTVALSSVFPNWFFSGTIVAPSSVSDYAVWVVNRVTKAHSTYTNWNVNSHGDFDGAEIVAMSDGLYALTGTTDGASQITAKVYWPPSNFGSDKQQRVDTVYVRLRGSDTPIKIVATTDEVERRIYTGSMTGFPDGIHPKRVLFTRHLYGNMWQIGFENTQGGGFTLAEVEVITVPSTNRRLK